MRIVGIALVGSGLLLELLGGAAWLGLGLLVVGVWATTRGERLHRRRPPADLYREVRALWGERDHGGQ